MRYLLFVLALILGSTSRALADERPFVYALDPVGPQQGEVEANYALTVGSSQSGAIRFVDPTLGNGTGVVQQVGAQAGLIDQIAIGAFGLMSTAPGATSLGTGGGYVHVTAIAPSPERDRGGTLGFTLYGVREFEGVFAMSLFLNGGYTIRGLTIAGNAQFERRFTSRADGIDLLARLGVTYDVLRGRESALRVGVEYVGQDLEDAFEEEEAEGGAIHLIALSSTASLVDRRLSLGLAPGMVVRAAEVGFGGRFFVGFVLR